MRQSSLQKNSGRLLRPFANKRDYESSMLGGKGSRSDGLGFRSRWRHVRRCEPPLQEYLGRL